MHLVFQNIEERVLAQVWEKSELTDAHEVFQNLVNGSISSENWVSCVRNQYSKLSARQYFLENSSFPFLIHKKSIGTE